MTLGWAACNTDQPLGIHFSDPVAKTLNVVSLHAKDKGHKGLKHTRVCHVLVHIHSLQPSAQLAIVTSIPVLITIWIITWLFPVAATVWRMNGSSQWCAFFSSFTLLQPLFLRRFHIFLWLLAYCACSRPWQRLLLYADDSAGHHWAVLPAASPLPKAKQHMLPLPVFTTEHIQKPCHADASPRSTSVAVGDTAPTVDGV